MEQPPRKQNVVGPAVRKLRMAAGLSQEELSARLQVGGWDISRAGLSKIEAGLRRVNDAELWVLARILKCGLADLYPKRLGNIDQVLRRSTDSKDTGAL